MQISKVIALVVILTPIACTITEGLVWEAEDNVRSQLNTCEKFVRVSSIAEEANALIDAMVAANPDPVTTPSIEYEIKSGAGISVTLDEFSFHQAERRFTLIQLTEKALRGTASAGNFSVTYFQDASVSTVNEKYVTDLDYTCWYRYSNLLADGPVNTTSVESGQETGVVIKAITGKVNETLTDSFVDNDSFKVTKSGGKFHVVSCSRDQTDCPTRELLDEENVEELVRDFGVFKHNAFLDLAPKINMDKARSRLKGYQPK